MDKAEVKHDASSTGFRLLQRRSAGVLLHPTSLPGPHGVGDMGPSCVRFLDFLAAAKASVWQVLPMGPTGYGGSPYQSTSSFAGNPLLISLEWLAHQGLLDNQIASHRADSSPCEAQWEEASRIKKHAMEFAFQRFHTHRNEHLKEGFARFKDEQAWWLEDYALFAALKEEHDGAPWYAWPQELIGREPNALWLAGERLRERVEYRRFVQFIWATQWHEVRAEAQRRGILIMGDIPIFPAHDSADVWAHQRNFKLDEKGLPTAVAGVPPDYFSETGQLWGNPVYQWDAVEEGGYDWWEKRLGYTFVLTDIVRLDHFRGFMAAWEVPAGESTAINGAWVPGPGRRIFEHLRRVLGPLPIVAENLGVITPDVEEARQEFGFPGMNILQFAFDSDAANPHMPHNQGRDVVTYTGTHDNDTTVGWYRATGDAIRHNLREYLGRAEVDIPVDLIRLAYAASANTSIIPLQDVLRLDGSARMNFPGRQHGNWRWRFTADQLQDFHAQPLAELARIFGRLPNAEWKPQ